MLTTTDRPSLVLYAAVGVDSYLGREQFTDFRIVSTMPATTFVAGFSSAHGGRHHAKICSLNNDQYKEVVGSQLGTISIIPAIFLGKSTWRGKRNVDRCSTI